MPLKDKDLAKERRRARYLRDRDKEIARAWEWFKKNGLANTDAKRARWRRYREKHREHELERGRVYYRKKAWGDTLTRCAEIREKVAAGRAQAEKMGYSGKLQAWAEA